MKLLYFCRHGESEHGAKNLVVGSTDSPLTEQGRAQAKSAGKSAKDLGIEYIVSSPLSRAHDTARIIAEEIHFPVNEIEVNSLTRERHFGEMEAQPHRIDMDLDGFTDVEAVGSVVERARLLLKHLETLDANTILIVSHAGFGRALRHIFHPNVPVYGEGSEPFQNAKIYKLV